MIATDLVARGIDWSACRRVVNYDLPLVPEDYIHRVGRCGRAGLPGNAINLLAFTPKRAQLLRRSVILDDLRLLDRVADFLLKYDETKKGKHYLMPHIGAIPGEFDADMSVPQKDAVRAPSPEDRLQKAGIVKTSRVLYIDEMERKLHEERLQSRGVEIRKEPKQ